MDKSIFDCTILNVLTIGTVTMNPVIEGLRALGALMVVTHHYTYFAPQSLASSVSGLHFFHSGVDLFFVITGYLFASLLLGEKTTHSSKFLKRRFFRLYPLYFVSLITFILTATSELPNLTLFIEHLLLLQSMPYNTISEASFISLVYWSLATELQFYIFVLLMSVLYRFVKVQNKALLLCVLSLLGFSISAYSNYQPRDETWLLYQAQLPALLIEFFFGVMVYSLMPKITNNVTKIALAIFGLALIAVLYYVYPKVVESSMTGRPFGWFNVLCALGYASVMAALLAWNKSQVSSTSKMATLLIFLGGLSYSVYLFHEIAIRWGSTISFNEMFVVPAALLLTLIVASVTNRWIEIPLREYGRR